MLSFSLLEKGLSIDSSQVYLGKPQTGLHACTEHEAWLLEAISDETEVDTRRGAAAHGMMRSRHVLQNPCQLQALAILLISSAHGMVHTIQLHRYAPCCARPDLHCLTA